MDEKATISRRAVGKHIIVRLPIVSVGVIKIIIHINTNGNSLFERHLLPVSE